MAFGQMPFAVRQAIGEWAERTLIHYFSETRRYVALHYGERWGGRRRLESDAANRPDLLILSQQAIDILRQRGIDPTALELEGLPDDDPRLTSIVAEAMVALETKISFRYYDRGRVNFIIDEQREARYATWLGRTAGIGSLVVWFTLDRAFIAPMDLILTQGTREERTYEGRGRLARTKMTCNLPVEQGQPFADVTGVTLNRSLRPRLRRAESGAITVTIEDAPGILQNVDLEALERLAAQVRR